MKIRSRRDAGEAIQWTGDNTAAVMEFVGDKWDDGQDTWLKQKWNGAGFAPDFFLVIHHDEVTLAKGEWLIRSTSGGLRPCSPAEFAENYEAAE